MVAFVHYTKSGSTSSVTHITTINNVTVNLFAHQLLFRRAHKQYKTTDKNCDWCATEHNSNTTRTKLQCRSAPKKKVERIQP